MNETLTLRQLIEQLANIMEADPSNENLPVMLVENIFRKGAIQPTIRHLTSDDVKVEPNMHLTGDFVYSQFDKGVVLGFVTIVE
jgi:hypothetical protein